MGMGDAQLVTISLATIPTFLAVLVGIFINNHQLNDARHLLRAEMGKHQSELLVKFAEMDQRLNRLEERRWS